MADKRKEQPNKKGKTNETPPEEKKGSWKNAALCGVILLLVLALVAVAAYRDGTGFDFLRRWLAYGEEELGASYDYDAATDNRFALLGKGMAVLSGTELRIFRGNGTVALSKQVNLAAPALQAAGELAVAYDVGGTRLWLVNTEGEVLLDLEKESSEPIIAASVNAAGYLAVTAEKKGCKGCVSVYDRQQKLIFEFNSVERFVTDARVAEDGRTVTAVTLGQEDGSFVSSMVTYDVTKTEPQGAYAVSGGVVLAMDERNGRQITVSDTVLTFAEDGEIAGQYRYDGEYLRGWAVGEEYVALLLNRYYAGSIGRIVTVGHDGKEIASLDVEEEVISLSAAGRYIAVLCAGELKICSPELLEYAALEGTDRAKTVLMCDDGSALVLESESGTRFVP